MMTIRFCFIFLQKLFPDLTLTATLAQYTADRDRSWSSSGALENRDVLLDILSDAMVVAPLVQLVDIQSEVNDNTYFYVFGHRSALNEYDVVITITQCQSPAECRIRTLRTTIAPCRCVRACHESDSMKTI